jgi:hypothetical protein
MSCNFNRVRGSRLMVNVNTDCESGLHALMDSLLRLQCGRMRTLYAAVLRSLCFDTHRMSCNFSRTGRPRLRERCVCAHGSVAASPTLSDANTVCCRFSEVRAMTYTVRGCPQITISHPSCQAHHVDSDKRFLRSNHDRKHLSNDQMLMSQPFLIVGHNCKKKVPTCVASDTVGLKALHTLMHG